MPIQKTVENPVSRRITVDVPKEIPVGPVILTFTPAKPAAPQKTPPPRLTRQMIDDMLPGSITESLTGALSPTDMTLEELRAERLGKYL
jgi:hypothetical protein